MDEVIRCLKDLPYEDLGWAKIDHHRGLRKGVPEAVFGEGKDAGAIAEIARRMHEMGAPVIVTRVSPDKAMAVKREAGFLSYNPVARLLYCSAPHHKDRAGDDRVIVPVFTAGTSDLPVAEEASTTLEVYGVGVKRVYDCGVAGIHRLFRHMETIREAPVIIAVAGMDGVLPGVVASIAPCPVIGVPTSIGYGANLHGIAPLLTMLNTCSQGLTVVNIDNGFGAACAAFLMVKKMRG